MDDGKLTTMIASDERLLVDWKLSCRLDVSCTIGLLGISLNSCIVPGEKAEESMVKFSASDD